MQVSLTAAGTVGSLDVVLPSSQLKQHVTHESTISHAYPYKFMKAALTGVAGLRADLTTQVAIDFNGMLKVRGRYTPGGNSRVRWAPDCALYAGQPWALACAVQLLLCTT